MLHEVVQDVDEDPVLRQLVAFAAVDVDDAHFGEDVRCGKAEKAADVAVVLLQGFDDFHRQSGADLTVATIPVTADEAPAFGILKTDEDGVITEFHEKPPRDQLDGLDSPVGGIANGNTALFVRTQVPPELVGEDWTEFPQFIARVRGADPAAVIRPEALAAITQAKADGHRLAILSNELDLFYGKDFRDKLPFLSDFDLIVDATYTGILKPDTRAFGFVTDGLGLSASDCVFVDDQKKNLRGAEAVGMPFVHFDVTRPAESYAQALGMLQDEKALP